MANSNTAVAASGEPQITVSAAAREALERADGDPIKATKYLSARGRKDAFLYRLLTEPSFDNTCYEAIRVVCRAQRRVLWNAPQPTTEEQRTKVVALGRGTMDSLLWFQLPGGKFLANAKRDDVSAAAEFYRKQSNDMGGKAKWLQLIAQHIPAKKTVKQVMTDARLAELREEATRD